MKKTIDIIKVALADPISIIIILISIINYLLPSHTTVIRKLSFSFIKINGRLKQYGSGALVTRTAVAAIGANALIATSND